MISVFLATILGHIAWPATAMTIAYWFRDEVRRALLRLAVVKIHDIEATFESELKAAEAATLAVPHLVPAVAHELDGGIEAIDPASAVVAAWRSLEESPAVDALERLRALGLRVEQGVADDLTADRARRYVSTAGALARSLRRP